MVGDECSICQQNFELDPTIVHLGCSHKYHKVCIETCQSVGGFSCIEDVSCPQCKLDAHQCATREQALLCHSVSDEENPAEPGETEEVNPFLSDEEPPEEPPEGYVPAPVAVWAERYRKLHPTNPGTREEPNMVSAAIEGGAAPRQPRARPRVVAGGGGRLASGCEGGGVHCEHKGWQAQRGSGLGEGDELLQLCANCRAAAADV